MIDLVMAAELEQLAARVACIRPMSNANPHAFYEERSEVAAEIRRMANRLRSPDTAPAAAADVPAAVGRQATRHSVRHVAGRTVLVLTRRASDLPAVAHPFY